MDRASQDLVSPTTSRFTHYLLLLQRITRSVVHVKHYGISITVLWEYDHYYSLSPYTHTFTPSVLFQKIYLPKGHDASHSLP